MMNRPLVGVLMGGPSSEHDVSLMTGTNILKTLEMSGRWRAVPITITKSGHWLYGEDRFWRNPGEAIANVDVICNALHGFFGEDGKVQQIFEHHAVPYNGSRIFASAVAFNKILARKILRKKGLLMPRAVVARRYGDESYEDLARRVLRILPPPWVVKPVASGSSVGVSLVKHVDDLPKALEHACAHDDSMAGAQAESDSAKAASDTAQALAEEYKKGREITCGILEHFRGEHYMALPPIEICPPSSASFFNYQVKYDGSTNEICPAEFSDAMLKKIRETAIAAHTALGCRDYSRTDMILCGTDLYVLEVNTLPGLTLESLFPKAAAAIGLSFPNLLEHMMTRAIERKEKR